ncbi:MAG: glycosidase [bacterium]|nr:glycosidase [bacterium]
MDTVYLTRYKNNPILRINKNNNWECTQVCNPGVEIYKGKVYILYRAGGTDMMTSASGWPVSRLGLAVSEDGFNVIYRTPEPVLKPEDEEWTDIEGIEDPRISKIGDKYYIIYVIVGFRWDRIALATTTDFKNFRRHGVIMKDIAQRTSALFPEKFDNQFILVHRMVPSIWFSKTEDFKKFTSSKIILTPDTLPWSEKKIGVAGPPIRIGDKWVMFFHGVDRHNTYRVGICWLDGKNPYKVIRIQKEPVLEPEADNERNGFTPNVVYPCGNIEKNGNILVYYGAGDKDIGVAYIEKEKLEF